MAKLFNTRSELIALRSICSPDPVVSGYLLSKLDSSYFYNDEAIEVFDLIKSEFLKSGRIPRFRLVSEDIRLSEGARELLAESDTPVKDITQCEFLVGSLGKLRKTRLYYLLARDILSSLEKTKVDIDEVADSLSRKLSRIHAVGVGDADIIHFGKNSNAFDLIREQLYDDSTNSVIPTGFDTWDNVNGGMLRGSLVVIGGTSGGGKSILANQLAGNQALGGYSTTFTPLEMSTPEMLSRTMSSVSGIDSIDIVLHRLASGERDLVWKRTKRFNRRIEAAGGKMTIFKPRRDMAIEEIMSALHSTNSDVDYIDYVSLLKGVGGDDAWQKLGEVARFGKIYAETHKKVVVLLVQVSEDGKIRYSQAMKEHASLAWIFVASKESKQDGYLNISTLKSRNQVNMDFTLKIEYKQTRVTDLDPKEMEDLNREKEKKNPTTKRTRQSAAEASKNEEAEELPDL